MVSNLGGTEAEDIKMLFSAGSETRRIYLQHGKHITPINMQYADQQLRYGVSDFGSGLGACSMTLDQWLAVEILPPM